MINVDDTGVLHEVTVPVGREGVEIAPFIWYNFYTDSPELLATRGRGHPVHSCPLEARPQPYPLPPFTRRHRMLFHQFEPYTPAVDRALDIERDVTLRAEVQRYRRAVARANRLTNRIAPLKCRYNEERMIAEESMNRLAQADAYSRILARVTTDVPDERMLPVRVVNAAIVAVNEPDRLQPRRQVTECTWCHKDTHDITQCSMIRQCLLCESWGHLEHDCKRPHRHCLTGEMCRVPVDHPRYYNPCRATIRSFATAD